MTILKTKKFTISAHRDSFYVDTSKTMFFCIVPFPVFGRYTDSFNEVYAIGIQFYKWIFQVQLNTPRNNAPLK